MKQGDTVRLTAVLGSEVLNLLATKAVVKAILKSPDPQWRYLRLAFTTGPARGKELSLLCRANVVASDLCHCNKYPFPHTQHGITPED